MLRVQKRDNNFQEFSTEKIKKAVLLAFDNALEIAPNVSPLVQQVVDLIIADTGPNANVSVDFIQTKVEQALMSSGHFDVAKLFIIYRDKRNEARKKRLKPDNQALADYIHISKYARWRDDLGRRELYAETVQRVKTMHITKYQHLIDDQEFVDALVDAFEFVKQKKVLPSMRSMQFAGQAALRENERMYNCSFTLIDRPRVFQEIIYLLLCGSGVGFSVQWEHISKLPPIARMNKHRVYHHTVEDTIIGWADAVGALIKGAIEGYWVEFNYSPIRGEGVRLRTSGGRAPGHLPLRDCLEKIREILLAGQGRKLRPIEWNDVVCHLAEPVLAGGIRRSSLITIFSADDTEMMYSKAQGNFRWAHGNDPGLNPHRAMANISARLDRGSVNKDLFNRIISIAAEGYGEPGFFFSNHVDYGTNPCGEIGLNPTIDGKTGFSFCNLCEINAAMFESELDFYQAAEAAAVIGTLQAGFTTFPYLGEVTQAIAERDSLLGVGITGMMDNPEIALSPEYQQRAAAIVVETNRRMAKIIGINPAQRCTTVKPSGTASLELGGVGSGIHPQHARRFFRGVTANRFEPPAMEFKRVNPHMVLTKPNGDWMIRFPFEVSDKAVTVKSLPAADFLRHVFDTYENWILPGTSELSMEQGLTHNVSCTVSVRPDEIELVHEAAWENRHRVQAMSFVPINLDESSIYMPRKSIATDQDERDWNSIIKLYKKIDWSKFTEGDDFTNLIGEVACAGGACEL
jgi:ribonucleoside-diphosphate reductase alpha chain